MEVTTWTEAYSALGTLKHRTAVSALAIQRSQRTEARTRAPRARPSGPCSATAQDVEAGINVFETASVRTKYVPAAMTGSLTFFVSWVLTQGRIVAVPWRLLVFSPGATVVNLECSTGRSFPWLVCAYTDSGGVRIPLQNPLLGALSRALTRGSSRCPLHCHGEHDCDIMPDNDI